MLNLEMFNTQNVGGVLIQSPISCPEAVFRTTEPLLDILCTQASCMHALKIPYS